MNGGELSHYNSEQKDSNGEDIFIKELIPHIDSKYRTINHRSSSYLLIRNLRIINYWLLKNLIPNKWKQLIL